MGTIPEQFFGSWKLDKSENFDNYLAAKGVNWLLRKLIGMSSITKVIAKTDQPERYSFSDLSSKMNLEYKDFALGEEFEGKGFDGEQHKITFDMADPETLTEKHIRTTEPNDEGTTYRYMIKNGELVLTLQHADILCHRYFKRL